MGSFNVLVLVPDSRARLLLVDCLERAGFGVFCAEDAAAALTALRNMGLAALFVVSYPSHALLAARLRTEKSLGGVPLVAVCDEPALAPEEAVAFIRTPADTDDLMQWALLLCGSDVEALVHQRRDRVA